MACLYRLITWKCLAVGVKDFCISVTGETEDICIVERLFSSSLVAIVSLSAPRKLKVCHFKVRQKEFQSCFCSYISKYMLVCSCKKYNKIIFFANL